MLDVRRLGVLCEVATRGSFSAAAESPNVTRSAVSHSLAILVDVGREFEDDRRAPALAS